jgi:hypothetical protein
MEIARERSLRELALAVYALITPIIPENRRFVNNYQQLSPMYTTSTAAGDKSRRKHTISSVALHELNVSVDKVAEEHEHKASHKRNSCLFYSITPESEHG